MCIWQPYQATLRSRILGSFDRVVDRIDPCEWNESWGDPWRLEQERRETVQDHNRGPERVGVETVLSQGLEAGVKKNGADDRIHPGPETKRRESAQTHGQCRREKTVLEMGSILSLRARRETVHSHGWYGKRRTCLVGSSYKQEPRACSWLETKWFRLTDMRRECWWSLDRFQTQG